MLGGERIVRSFFYWNKAVYTYESTCTKSSFDFPNALLSNNFIAVIGLIYDSFPYCERGLRSTVHGPLSVNLGMQIVDY